MENLPDDIRRNILFRVPVKNLMRFKTVCKPWYSLIRSPVLGKLQCDNASKTGTSSSFIMFRCCFKNKGNVFYSIDYRSLSSKLVSSATCNPLGDSSEMDYPSRSANCRQLWGSYRKEFEIILGSSKGLMCLRSKKPGYEDAICLWNPCTREYKTVPESPHNFRSSSTSVDIGLYGLGYDEKNVNGDFKVVRVSQVDSRAECFDFSVDESETEVVEFGRSYSVYEIYTLNSNSWKKCQTMPYEFHGELKSGVMVNGALHRWAIKRRDGFEAIISFDFTDEIFKEVAIIEGSMKHPPGSDKAYENNNVGVLGGCLCVLHKTLDKVDVWVMQEYGVNESWMKRFTIMEEFDTMSLRIVCDFPNSAVLFKTDDSMIYYDPNHRTERTRKLTIPGTDHLYGAEICVISLVPLHSGTYCENIKKYMKIG